MSDNTDFTVIGVIGPPGVGKSTIINELYGYDGRSPGLCFENYNECLYAPEINTSLCAFNGDYKLIIIKEECSI